ncbi:MAG: hypothetical protein HYV52_00820 [Parcubacteria group bacterium]|nr:hypothetical protein [Parcubacteria group bacterium]
MSIKDEFIAAPPMNEPAVRIGRSYASALAGFIAGAIATAVVVGILYWFFGPGAR